MELQVRDLIDDWVVVTRRLNDDCSGKEEFDDKQKEVEKVVNPIMSKLYAGGAGGASGSSGEDEEMPDHDEL